MTHSAFHQILLLFSIQMALVLVHQAACVIACLATHIRVERIGILFGKPVAVLQTRLCPVAIGWVPYGGYVRFDNEDFGRRPLLTRWLVVCSPPLATLISACVFLRYDVAALHFTEAFLQIINGTLAPFEQGVPLIRAFFSKATQSGFAGYGILAAKAAAFSLLPITSQSGGRLLTEIPDGRENSALGKVITIIGLCGAALISFSWSIALVSYFLHL
jgi:membrane-associated protease RseP (regulator of RpoE activity)